MSAVSVQCGICCVIQIWLAVLSLRRYQRMKDNFPAGEEKSVSMIDALNRLSNSVAHRSGAFDHRINIEMSEYPFHVIKAELHQLQRFWSPSGQPAGIIEITNRAAKIRIVRVPDHERTEIQQKYAALEAALLVSFGDKANRSEESIEAQILKRLRQSQVAFELGWSKIEREREISG